MQRRTMLAASAALAATGLGGGSAATEHPEVGRFKAVYLIRRRPDIDHAEFRRRQTEDHYPLVEALPGLHLRELIEIAVGLALARRLWIELREEGCREKKH